MQRRSRINWAHLLLLAALPVWFAASDALPSGARVAIWLAFCFLVLAFAERVRPHRIDWFPDRRGWRRDGSVLSLNAVVDAAVSASLALAATKWIDVPSAWPFWLEVLVGLAAGELLAYALHRYSHHAPWWWRVHLLHHRPERLNVANALTAHPLNALYDRAAHLLPLLAIGASDEAIVAVTLFTLTQNLAVHANVGGTIGALSRVVGSAELHRLHHSTHAGQAVNFGTALPWWDHVFGTFRWREAPMQVGVFEPSRYPDEYALGALLAWPFRHPGRR